MELCIMCDNNTSSLSILGMQDDSLNTIVMRAHLIQLFSSYFNLPPEKLELLKRQLDQDFPFCSRCEPILTNLSRLQATLTSTQNDIGLIIGHIVSGIMKLVSEQPVVISKSPVIVRKFVAIQEMRQTICANYKPRVIVKDSFLHLKSSDRRCRAALWGPPPVDLNVDENEALNDPLTDPLNEDPLNHLENKESHQTSSENPFEVKAEPEIETEEEEEEEMGVENNQHSNYDDGEYQDHHYDDDVHHSDLNLDPIKEEPPSPPQQAASSINITDPPRKKRGRPPGRPKEKAQEKQKLKSLRVQKKFKAPIVPENLREKFVTYDIFPKTTRKKKGTKPIGRPRKPENQIMTNSSPASSSLRKTWKDTTVEAMETENNVQQENPGLKVKGRRGRRRKQDMTNIGKSDTVKSQSRDATFMAQQMQLSFAAVKGIDPGLIISGKRRRVARKSGSEFTDLTSDQEDYSDDNREDVASDPEDEDEEPEEEIEEEDDGSKDPDFDILRSRAEHGFRVRDRASKSTMYQEKVGVFRIRDTEFRFYQLPDEEGGPDGYFTCKVCDVKIKRSEHAVYHYRRYHDTTCLRCDKCKLPFHSEEALEDHREFSCKEMLKEKKGPDLTFRPYLESPGVYRLPDFDYRFYAVPNEEDFFTCGVCNKKMKSKNKIARHYHLYHDKNCARCEKCNAPFVVAGSMKRHVCRRIPGPGRRINYKDLGDGKFLYLTWPYEAIELDPETGNCLKCGTCQVLKGDERLMIYHIKGVHMDRKFMCETCGRVFNSQARLNHHVQSAHGYLAPSFICEDCGATFHHKKGLSQHARSSHGIGLRPNDLKCPDPRCGIEFDTYGALVYHRQKTKHKAPNRRIKGGSRCGRCGNRFFTENKLKAHVETCQGRKDVPCVICQKVYKNKTCLQSHMKHTHKLTRDQLDEDGVFPIDEVYSSQVANNIDQASGVSSSSVIEALEEEEATATIATTSTTNNNNNTLASSDPEPMSETMENEDVDLDWTSITDL